MSGTRTQNLRLPGQYFQIETNLAYNHHRHYDPTTGRYTQPDPLGFVDGPSIYAYAGSSPFMVTDPSGLYVPRVPNPNGGGGWGGGSGSAGAGGGWGSGGDGGGAGEWGGNGGRGAGAGAGAGVCEQGNHNHQNFDQLNPNIQKVGWKEVCIIVCHLLLGAGENGGIKSTRTPRVYPTEQTKKDKE
jgi:RHS repeat-associated protein